jgi:hypothetical protein
MDTLNYNELLKCQRNWDLTRNIQSGHQEKILDIVRRPPQQQGECMFSCIVLNDHEPKEDLYKILSSLDTSKKLSPRHLQPQVLANMVVLWTVSQDPDETDENLITQKFFHCGFHSGIVAQSANILGYKTSFTRCGPYYRNDWIKFLNKYGFPTNDNYEFVMALGIGYGKPNTPYNQNHIMNSLQHTHHEITTPKVFIK